MLKYIVIVLLLGIVGVVVYFYPTGKVMLDSQGQVEVIKKALEYINSNPIVANSQGGVKLEDFWEQSHIGVWVDKRFGQDWLSNNAPLVYPIGDNKWGVQWVGLPGCVSKDSLKLGYDPVLVDGNGNKCETWWMVTVEVDEKTSDKKLVISEKGYGEEL